MYKTLCVVILLVGVFALAGRNSVASPATSVTSPQIVAKGRLVNQTAPIPTTTIFTPAQNGLYRLSVYATVSKADASSSAFWFYSAGWTDEAGIESAFDLLNGYSNTLGQFQSPGLYGGASLTFEAKAGTPVTYSVTHDPPSPDNSVYALYYTLERLE
jgi:hypothetical protein